jgi:sulfur carrier protein ThiS
MFPSPQSFTIKAPSTLRGFMESLGSDVLYAYERKVIVVLVNGERRWPSSRLRAGDRVVVFPIVTGG